MARVNLSDYARIRGVSKQAVHEAALNGRITVETDAAGKKTLDVDQANREWQENTNHTMRDIAAGRTLKEAESESSPKPKTDNEDQADLTYSKARARREFYQSELARLEFEEEFGRLVCADEVAEKWTGIATLVRTKVLAIPSKLRQKTEITDEIYFVLEQIVRDALEDLSNGTD